MHTVTESTDSHLLIRECEFLLARIQNKDQCLQSHGANYSSVHRSTYRQKLLKADLIVLVAVEFLDDVPNHVARLGMADAFQERLEFKITDMSIFVEICMDQGIKC